MHDEARNFTVFVKGILPEFFTNKKVLDIGSGDINGNNRFLFEGCHYEGNDVIQAPNVTIVSKTGALPFADNTFDTIVSTECFEHDPEYIASWKKAYAMLKPGGLFCFTCASTNRGEHGTRRTSPKCSYGTIGGLEDMSDYYKNLTEQDLNKALDLNSSFVVWNTYYNAISCDLYFVGIKKAEDNMYKSPLPIYSALSVAETSAYILKPYKIIDLYPSVSKEDWVFYEGYDSGGGDIRHDSTKSVDELCITASFFPGCIAFNSIGYMKGRVIFPLIKSEWLKSPHGIYIRKNILSGASLRT
ncbi:MAG: class I SAM-dependent methyltransferase [Actinobacteria bacterium]|nr:class I SAM-dependent methyltransferase [Actinomycetota bacterium]